MFFLSKTSLHNFDARREIENLMQFKEYFLHRNYSLKTLLSIYVTVFYNVMEDIWNLAVVEFMHEV